MENLILVGAGGHCRAAIDVIEAEAKFRIIGIISLPEEKNKQVLSYQVIGTDQDLPELVKEHHNCLITIGQIESALLRAEKFEYLKKINAHFPIIISPSARVSKHSQIGEGTIIMHNALVNANAVIGENCIINTSALIEHDVEIGQHCHVSTRVTINGGVKMGNFVFIGSRSVLNNGIALADKVIIGSGSTVTRDCSESGTYAGYPAKKINE